MSSFHRPSRSARAVLVAACLGTAVTLTGCGDNAEPMSSGAAPSGGPSSALSALSAPASSTSSSVSDPADASQSPGSPAPSASSAPASSPPTSSAPTSSAPSAPTTSAAPDRKPEVIAYAGGESPGVLVRGPGDTAQLHRSPVAFKRFVGRTAQRVVDRAPCSDATVGVMVQFVSTAGSAVGSVNECGGYAALWAVVDGQWRQVEGTQDAWSCKVLERYTVPSDMVGDTCYDYEAHQERPYHQV